MVDDLLGFLEDNNIKPDPSKNQAIALKDAILYLYVEDGIPTLHVERIDSVELFHDVSIEHFIDDEDMAMFDEYDDEDWEDEYDEDFEIEQEIIRQEAEKALIKELLKDTVDGLLDKYNIAMAMYNEFGDEEYKQRADQIIEDLKLTKLE
ncbi:hypothetical protein ACW5UC_24940 [Priestia aryabhattai]|uniref:hypothetical protein n=1 Tax=Priestia megaterium TaxID=1404 RepID=UPI003F952E3A